MSLQHYKSKLNEVSRHLIGNSVPPNNILIPFSLSSAQKKIGYHYWLLMQGSLLTEEGLKHSLYPAQWSNSLAQKLNSNIEFIGFSIEVVILKNKILIMKKNMGKKAQWLPYVFHWILHHSETGYSLITKWQCIAKKKKHFSFSSLLIVPDTVFLLGHFRVKPKKLLIWMELYHKDKLEDQFKDKVLPKLYLKSFQAALCFYELILLWYLLKHKQNFCSYHICPREMIPQFRIIYEVSLENEYAFHMDKEIVLINSRTEYKLQE